jgi:hypothetical protein
LGCATLKTPPTWYFNPTRIPGTVSAHLQKAIDWIDENRALATPTRLVMLYAWNEFGEGGYIAPTVGDLPDRQRPQHRTVCRSAAEF